MHEHRGSCAPARHHPPAAESLHVLAGNLCAVSGIGASAASCVALARAAGERIGRPLSNEEANAAGYEVSAADWGRGGREEKRGWYSKPFLSTHPYPSCPRREKGGNQYLGGNQVAISIISRLPH